MLLIMADPLPGRPMRGTGPPEIGARPFFSGFSGEGRDRGAEHTRAHTPGCGGFSWYRAARVQPRFKRSTPRFMPLCDLSPSLALTGEFSLDCVSIGDVVLVNVVAHENQQRDLVHVNVRIRIVDKAEDSRDDPRPSSLSTFSHLVRDPLIFLFTFSAAIFLLCISIFLLVFLLSTA